MRRGLASLIMALALVVASASWAGFILSRTVLDPGRSERLADQLLDNEDVRAVIVDRLADAVEARIPASVPVTRRTIEAAAERALEDPRVEAVVRDGIVQAHQNALNGIDEPVTLDASALGEVGREQIVAIRPELDAVLPQAPSLEVELPNTGLSWLGAVKNAVDRFTRISAAIAVIGMTAAFLVAKNRPAALRRVAYWAFGASLFWLVAAYAVPAILQKLAPSSVAISSAIMDVFFGAMIRPALTLATVGVIFLGISIAWPAIVRRRPAAMLDRSRSAGPAAIPGWTPANSPLPPRSMVKTPVQVDNVQDWPADDAPTRIWSPGSPTPTPTPNPAPAWASDQGPQTVPTVPAASPAPAWASDHNRPPTPPSPETPSPQTADDGAAWVDPNAVTQTIPTSTPPYGAEAGSNSDGRSKPGNNQPGRWLTADEMPTQIAAADNRTGTEPAGYHWVEGVGYVEDSDPSP